MAQQPICAYSGCNKKITERERGVIRDGKTFHERCYNLYSVGERSRALEKLYNAFPNMQMDVLEDIYVSIVEIGVRKEEDVYKDLRANWAVVTYRLNGEETDIDVFTSKTKLSNWLAEAIKIAMEEDYGFDILYILNRGKVVVEYNQFKIKVAF